MILIPDDRPVLFITIGLPCSGKSTAAREIAGEFEIPVVAYDRLREAAAGAQVPQGMGHKFLDWAADMVGYYLCHGQSVVYDAHNLNRAVRERFIRSARALGANACGIWTVCDTKTLLRRLEEAECPKQLLMASQAAFERPQLQEGFHQVSIFETGFRSPFGTPGEPEKGTDP